MALVLNGSGITSANIADGTITTDDILASDVSSLKSGRKNLIINGGMDVWQRGTPIATMGFGADRWRTYSTNSGTANYNVNNTQVADSPLSAGGYSYSVAVADTSVGIDFITVTQLIEQANLTAINTGDSLTLSFWIKKTRDLAADATFKVIVKTPAATKDTWTGVTYENTDSSVSTPISETYNSLSTSWVKKTATFTVTANMVTRGLGLCFQIGNNNVTAGAGSTAEIYRFTGVQLEVGSVATDFEHRSYGEELALCQRYFYRLNGGSNPTTPYFAQARAFNASIAIGHFNFPVSLRVNPSLTFNNITGYNGGSRVVTTIGLNGSSTTGCGLNFVASNFVAGQMVGMGFATSAAYLAFDAEL